MLPYCHRCRVETGLLDRVTINFDVDRIETRRFDLCQSCTQSLLRWIDPPADVRESWAMRRLGVER